VNRRDVRGIIVTQNTPRCSRNFPPCWRCCAMRASSRPIPHRLPCHPQIVEPEATAALGVSMLAQFFPRRVPTKCTGVLTDGKK